MSQSAGLIAIGFPLRFLVPGIIGRIELMLSAGHNSRVGLNKNRDDDATA
jgi:hypothetical protein